MGLSYCTNVHPAEDLPGLIGQFDRYAGPVRERLGADWLHLGLWLAADVAEQLASDAEALTRLRRELTARGLRVETLNAFPYHGFHAPVVKRMVYTPDWTDPLRLKYTVDCARVLGGLLSDDAVHGSISTLPLGWRTHWAPADDTAASVALDRVTRVLREVSARCGRPVVLAVEPEPGCVLDTVADAVGWLRSRADPDQVGLCLDTCHLAVSFAPPRRVVEDIDAAGLRVMKVQVSAALHVPDPADPVARAALVEFDEPRYLHQVREHGADGRVSAADDLPEALDGLPARGPWRVHYHVPLHAQPRAPLTSTSEVTRDALAALWTVDPERRAHLEVETYTWTVLPPRHRQELADGIAAELTWAARNLPVAAGADPPLTGAELP
jgi:sugar phosphate isomerase/epimerase